MSKQRLKEGQSGGGGGGVRETAEECRKRGSPDRRMLGKIKILADLLGERLVGYCELLVHPPQLSQGLFVNPQRLL